jgi:hypothetical protein
MASNVAAVAERVGDSVVEAHRCLLGTRRLADVV